MGFIVPRPSRLQHPGSATHPRPNAVLREDQGVVHLSGALFLRCEPLFDPALSFAFAAWRGGQCRLRHCRSCRYRSRRRFVCLFLSRRLPVLFPECIWLSGIQADFARHPVSVDGPVSLGLLSHAKNFFRGLEPERSSVELVSSSLVLRTSPDDSAERRNSFG